MSDVKFIVTTDETGAIKGFKKLEDAMGDIEKKAKTAGDKIQAMGERAVKLGKNMSMYVTAPILAAGGASVKMAMDAVESENLFEVAMGDMADSARNWSIEMRDQFGLNQYEIRQTVGTMDVMLKSMGLSETAAFDMSKGLVQLTYDMASFYNMRPEEAFQKLQAGISGEVEPLKRLGILVNENTTKQWALKTGLIKTGEALTEQQKILARYGAIMEQTSTAQGDLGRTLDSPTNKLRILKSGIQETSIEMGMRLLPLFERAVNTVSDITKWFSNLSDENKELILKFAGVAAVAGPLVIILGKMAESAAALSRVNKRTILFFGDLGLAIGAAYVAYKALIAIRDRFEKGSKKQQERDAELKSWQDLSGAIGGFTDFLQEAEKRELISVENRRKIWSKYHEDFVGGLKAISEGKEGKDLKNLLAELGGREYEVATGAEAAVDGLGDFKKAAGEMAGYLKTFLNPSLDDTEDKIIAVKNELVTTVTPAQGAITAVGELTSVTSDLAGEWKKVPGTISPAVAKIISSVEGIGTVTLSVTRDIKEELATMFQEWEEQMAKIGAVAFGFINQIGAISQQSFQNSMIQIDNESQAKNEALDKKLAGEIAAAEAKAESEKLAIENSLLSEEEKEIALLQLATDSEAAMQKIKDQAALTRETLEAATQKKISEARKKAAKADKAAALMGAMVNTAQAVTKTLTSVPFPLNIPLAIAVGILGAIQIGKIAKQPIPMAKGGLVKSPLLLGEEGTELVYPARKAPELAVEIMKHAGPMPSGYDRQLTSSLSQKDIQDLVAAVAREVSRRAIHIHNKIVLDGQVLDQRTIKVIQHGFTFKQIKVPAEAIG